jgi:hypothetical protein
MEIVIAGKSKAEALGFGLKTRRVKCESVSATARIMERTGGVGAIFHVIASLAQFDQLVAHHAHDFHAKNGTAAEKIVESLRFHETDLTRL